MQAKTNLLINQSAGIDETIDLIKNTAMEGANSEAVNNLLSMVPYTPGNDLEFLEKMFNRIKLATIYQFDESGKEQIKTPDRFLLKDGCGDCDDYTVLWSAILNRLHKKHNIKIVKYNNTDGWAHVFPIIPVTDGSYVIVDNVLGTFNKEVDYFNKGINNEGFRIF